MLTIGVFNICQINFQQDDDFDVFDDYVCYWMPLRIYLNRIVGAYDPALMNLFNDPAFRMFFLIHMSVNTHFMWRKQIMSYYWGNWYEFEEPQAHFSGWMHNTKSFCIYLILLYISHIFSYPCFILAYQLCTYLASWVITINHKWL